MTLNAYEFKVAATMAQHLGYVPVGWTPAQYVKHLCNIDAKAAARSQPFIRPNAVREGASPPEPLPDLQLSLPLSV